MGQEVYVWECSASSLSNTTWRRAYRAGGFSIALWYVIDLWIKQRSENDKDMKKSGSEGFFFSSL